MHQVLCHKLRSPAWFATIWQALFAVYFGKMFLDELPDILGYRPIIGGSQFFQAPMHGLFTTKKNNIVMHLATRAATGSFCRHSDSSKGSECPYDVRQLLTICYFCQLPKRRLFQFLTLSAKSAPRENRSHLRQIIPISMPSIEVISWICLCVAPQTHGSN